MITPLLEKTILSGKGIFKTFNAGGMGKNVIPVPEERFIIITKIVSYPHFPKTFSEISVAQATALRSSVYQINFNTEQRQYHYSIRNNFTQYYNSKDDTFPPAPGSPVNIDTYLVCQSDVAITFVSPGDFGLSTPAGAVKVTDIRSAGVQPVQGYGKEGQAPAPLSADTVRQADYNPGIFIRQNEFEDTGITQGSQVYNEYRIAVDDNTLYNTTLGQNNNLNENFNYPLVNINYVEIFGLPTDLQ